MFRDLNPLDLVMEDTAVGLSPIQVALQPQFQLLFITDPNYFGYGVIGSLGCSLFYKINSTGWI